MVGECIPLAMRTFYETLCVVAFMEQVHLCSVWREEKVKWTCCNVGRVVITSCTHDMGCATMRRK